MGMPWVTGDYVQVRGLCRAQQDARKQDAHLVPLVDALEPLQTKSKTISLMILFDVCVCIVCVYGKCVCVCVMILFHVYVCIVCVYGVCVCVCVI